MATNKGTTAVRKVSYDLSMGTARLDLEKLEQVAGIASRNARDKLKGIVREIENEYECFGFAKDDDERARALSHTDTMAGYLESAARDYAEAIKAFHYIHGARRREEVTVVNLLDEVTVVKEQPVASVVRLDDGTRKWLANEMTWWLNTWAETDEDDEDGGEYPDDLSNVVDKLNDNQGLTAEEYALVMFHMWQKFGQGDDNE